MHKPLLTAILLILISGAEAAGLNTFAQGFPNFSPAGDSSQSKQRHSPRKASIYSAVLPGLGQAYNRKYWKIPLVYAALGTSGYLFVHNRSEMKKRQDALTRMLDGDSNTVPAAEFARIPVDILRAQRNTYRTNGDISAIVFTGFYVLNIIDAVVDAHFYKFNIDKPLAARREKRWHLYSHRVGNTPVMGFSWRF